MSTGGTGGYEELPPYDPYAEWNAPTAYVNEATPVAAPPPAPVPVPPPAPPAAAAPPAAPVPAAAPPQPTYAAPTPVPAPPAPPTYTAPAPVPAPSAYVAPAVAPPRFAAPAFVPPVTDHRAPFTAAELALLPKAVYGKASFGQRAKAVSIDGIVCLVPSALILAFVLPHYFHQMAADPALHGAAGASATSLISGGGGRIVHWATVMTVAILAVYWVVLAIYTGFFMGQTNGQTPGRQAAGIRVVRNDGEPVTAVWAVFRVVIVREVLFTFAAFFTVGIASVAQYGWALWDHQGRTLHDLITRSREVTDTPTALETPPLLP